LGTGQISGDNSYQFGSVHWRAPRTHLFQQNPAHLVHG
jgi:hypothetical protein